MNGIQYRLDKGYWVKFSAHTVDASDQRPHGMSYSMSLHDRNGSRVVGFDNAHAVRTKKAKYAAKKVTWDHKHKHCQVTEYEFDTAAQLMDDFWKEVNAIVR
jgi:hypothetical protein